MFGPHVLAFLVYYDWFPVKWLPVNWLLLIEAMNPNISVASQGKIEVSYLN
jgi:hypothetical protein